MGRIARALVDTDITIEVVHHAHIVRDDVWADGFAEPRFSFLCAQGGPATAATACPEGGTGG